MALIEKIEKFFPLIRQLTRYGIVGLCAAGVHLSVVVFLVEVGQIKPLIANIFAFFVSFQVSYWGHRQWTFSGTTNSHRTALTRLLFVSSIALVANESLFYTFYVTCSLPYPLAVFLVLTILPPATFVIGKLWVFRMEQN